jgi:hypothetical protein
MSKNISKNINKTKVLKENEEGFWIALDEKESDKVPKWMDCSWRRVVCWDKKCPICGRILKMREKHLQKGEDPDDMKAVLEDVGETFRETAAMVSNMAKKHNIDLENLDKEEIEIPPRAHAYPLYREVAKWRTTLVKYIERSHGAGYDAWIHTEDGADILWYMNTLSAKTYRQLCNRWHLEQGDEYGKFDYTYTKRVLSEIIDILVDALGRLGALEGKRRTLKNSCAKLSKLRPHILKI